MFGIFKKKDPIIALQEKYKKLSQEAFELSHRDRTASDDKYTEAHALSLEIEKLLKK
jgi:hypothetical protein